MPFAAIWMDLEIIKLSEVRQTNIISLICGILKKKIQMNLFTKHKLRHRKQAYGYQNLTAPQPH